MALTVGEDPEGNSCREEGRLREKPAAVMKELAVWKL
jgi:hypothetical protein